MRFLQIFGKKIREIIYSQDVGVDGIIILSNL
jgi:hypothetical protein